MRNDLALQPSVSGITNKLTQINWTTFLKNSLHLPVLCNTCVPSAQEQPQHVKHKIQDVFSFVAKQNGTVDDHDHL